MRIILVSTYRQHCGIATYTEALAPALKDLGHDVVILAEADALLSQEQVGSIQYYRTWNRWSFRGATFAATITNAKVKTDVVHFQHEYGLFPNSTEFLIACKELRKAGIYVYVTLHTVHPPPTKSIFISSLLDIVNKVIVHTPAAAAQIAIKAYSPIKVIPHGVRLSPTTPNSIGFLCPGFISPSKGHNEILEGFAKFAAKLGGVGVPPLKILGLCRDHVYAQRLEQTITELGLESHVKIVNAYIGDDVLADEVSNAAAIILGAKGPSSPFSASGQMAIAAGCGKPIIAKNVPIYDGLPGALMYNDADELALFLNASRFASTDETSLIAEARAWPKVAEKHLAVYTEYCYA